MESGYVVGVGRGERYRFVKIIFWEMRENGYERYYVYYVCM